MAETSLSREQVAAAIVAKSDQLNADDLVGGPITVRVTSVRAGAADQPWQIGISDRRVPWRPCKTERRVIVAAWGDDPEAWIGRWLTLRRDPEVIWAGEPVGGIRILAMTDIPREGLSLALQASKKAKSRRVVDWMPTPAPPFGARLSDLVRAGTCTADQVRAALGGRKAAEVPPAEHAAILASLQPTREPGEDGGEE